MFSSGGGGAISAFRRRQRQDVERTNRDDTDDASAILGHSDGVFEKQLLSVRNFVESSGAQAYGLMGPLLPMNSSLLFLLAARHWCGIDNPLSQFKRQTVPSRWWGMSCAAGVDWNESLDQWWSEVGSRYSILCGMNEHLLYFRRVRWNSKLLIVGGAGATRYNTAVKFRTTGIR